VRPNGTTNPKPGHKASCKEHSCPKGRGAKGFCAKHEFLGQRHHITREERAELARQREAAEVKRLAEERAKNLAAQQFPTVAHPRLPSRTRRVQRRADERSEAKATFR
jgi:hypothetical protein